MNLSNIRDLITNFDVYWTYSKYSNHELLYNTNIVKKTIKLEYSCFHVPSFWWHNFMKNLENDIVKPRYYWLQV
ncbi:hypothetical protein K502DRAFT_111329 [Neoconidiobolus thromboides FSU 785]|nr:hypothetical protein K502DRAFT_111329 [Neoconidiobolus thromboides FSU 785]